MRFFSHLTITLNIALAAAASIKEDCPPFPSSMLDFSSNFEQPVPPLVKSEFNTSFVQHKWNQNLSHITAGYMITSPSKNFVRADEAFEGGIATSFFDYSNVTKDGLVDNTLTTYNDGSSALVVWRGYVNSNYPIFAEDILVSAGAVFGGLVRRQFIQGRVAAWNIMYQGAIPVTIYVTNCNVMVGYEYFSPGERTKVITDYFNIRVDDSRS
ncbi:hypothetical protein PT974_07108 [Cladobotryum mycophilum]|uniref:Uncharacterized protein n=1 Tax=Cladobotryum mycophilum TaxID=491253 RepID=A0ABR0SNB0_9HYPO